MKSIKSQHPLLLIIIISSTALWISNVNAAVTNGREQVTQITHKVKADDPFDEDIDSSTHKIFTPVTQQPNGEFSADVSLTSNYIWRGVSQTDNGPALQGSFGYEFHGVHVGVWGSSVDFDNGGNGYLELDWIAGYKKEFNNGFGFDIGITQYQYPQASGTDFSEPYLNLTYKFISLTTSYASNAFNAGDRGLYYDLTLAHDINNFTKFPIDHFNVGGHIGYYDLKGNAGNSYADYKLWAEVFLTKQISVGVAWTNTNGNFQAGTLDDAHLIGTLTASI